MSGLAYEMPGLSYDGMNGFTTFKNAPFFGRVVGCSVSAPQREENVEADNNDGNSLSNNVLVARIGTLLTPTVAGRANSTGIISFDDCGELLERKQRPAGSW